MNAPALYACAATVLLAAIPATRAAEPVALPADAAAAADAPAPVSAVWLQHEFSFTYFARGTFYSCDGFRNKIEQVLEAVGGRNARVSVGCFDSFGVQQLPTARIRVESPAEATPELLARLATDQTKRELVARVTGKGDQVDAATAQFPAQRQVVEIKGRRSGGFEYGDCELLEQLLPRVLEPMGVRRLSGTRLNCTPGMAQTGAVELRLETLRPLPAPGGQP
jgi:hypothetical protein